MKKNKVLGSVLASSMVLGMMVNSGMTIVNAAEASTPQTENVKPAGIEYQTQGDLTLSGTAMDGLELVSKNTVTRGNLNLRYDVKALASINWRDETEAIIQLPEEFNELAKSKKILDYIESPHFSYNSSTGNLEHDYTKDEITVKKDLQSNGYLLVLKNPELSGWGVNTKISVSMEMDLGAMVTDTGMRIPNAIDRQAYHFATTLAAVGEVIDWELVGNTNGSDRIPVEILDPGYNLLQEKVTIEQPVYDTSKVVSGKGYPGASVTIKNDKGEIVGEGTVNDSGLYHITLKQLQEAGTVLTATQNTGVGESEPATTVVEHDPNYIAPPVVDSDNGTILSTAKKITGPIADRTHIITIKNVTTGTQIQAVNLPNSTWVASTTGFMSAGNKLEVRESSADGQYVSEPTVLLVVDPSK